MDRRTLRNLHRVDENHPLFNGKKRYSDYALNFWKRTMPKYLEGLNENRQREMAMIMENQRILGGVATPAKRSLMENGITVGGPTYADSGQIEGYTSVSLPMVRRIFGSTVAHNAVSIQTMMAPTGLAYYIDFGLGSSVGGDKDARLQGPDTDEYAVSTYVKGDSVYGGGASGRDIQFGTERIGGTYGMGGGGYSRNHANAPVTNAAVAFAGAWVGDTLTSGAVITNPDEGPNGQAIDYDETIVRLIQSGETTFFFLILENAGDLLRRADFANPSQFALFTNLDEYGRRDSAGAIPVPRGVLQASEGIVNVRAFTSIGRVIRNPSTGDVVGFRRDAGARPDATDTGLLLLVHGRPDDGLTPAITTGAEAFQTSTVPTEASRFGLSFMLRSEFRTYPSGGTNLLPVGESDLAPDPTPVIPEITISTKPIPITSETHKLRSKWTEELNTDLRALLDLDVGATLMQTTADFMLDEIDSLVLEMLRTAAKRKYYWSARVGSQVDIRTGQPARVDLSDPTSVELGGTVSMNLQDHLLRLVRVINAAANDMKALTRKGQANTIIASPDLCSLMESIPLYQVSMNVGAQGQVDVGSMSLGVVPSGTLQNRYTVLQSDKLPRNTAIILYKGDDDLDAGAVMCPYVPLMLTPQVLGPEDFQPRQGASTRYAKEVIRADYFSLLIVKNLDTV